MTVIVPFTVEMGNVSVEVTAQFKEEVPLKQSISTKRHKIGFLKYDYSLNASFEVGNYTGVNFKAVVHTENEKESDAALGKRLEQVVELPLTAEEKAKFHDCCEGVRRNMEHLKDIP